MSKVPVGLLGLEVSIGHFLLKVSSDLPEAHVMAGDWVVVDHLVPAENDQQLIAFAGDGEAMIGFPARLADFTEAILLGRVVAVVRGVPRGDTGNRQEG